MEIQILASTLLNVDSTGFHLLQDASRDIVSKTKFMLVQGSVCAVQVLQRRGGRMQKTLQQRQKYIYLQSLHRQLLLKQWRKRTFRNVIIISIINLKKSINRQTEI